MFLCNRNLTPLQRRSMQQIGATVAVTGSTSMFFRSGMQAAHGSPVWALGLSLFYLAPVLVAIAIIARYLRQEPDEFVRALITRALLWGMGATMAADAVTGVLFEVYGGSVPLVILNADIFLVSTGIAFRLLQRSYR